jgi:hypothetical protein
MLAIKYGTHLRTDTDAFKLSKYDLNKLINDARRYKDDMNPT